MNLTDLQGRPQSTFVSGEADAFDKMAKVTLGAGLLAEAASLATKSQTSDRLRKLGFTSLVVSLGASMYAVVKHSYAQALRDSEKKSTQRER